MSPITIVAIDPTLRLREFVTGDEPAIVRHANDVEVSRWLRDRFASPYTLNDAKGWVMLNRDAKPATNFAIEHKGALVGGIGLVLGEDVHRFSAEVGYWLGRVAWGQNIATRAVIALSEYAFSRLLMVRLHASVFAGNSASIRVLEKSGFQYEGTRRCSVFKHGRHLDSLEYALVRPDAAAVGPTP
jgi:RimJ/RimL family protein N-acetyltransferase